MKFKFFFLGLVAVWVGYLVAVSINTEKAVAVPPTSNSTSWRGDSLCFVTAAGDTGLIIDTKNGKILHVKLDSAQITQYLAIQHANGDTTLVIKTANTGGDAGTIVVRGTTTHGPLVYFKTTTIDQLWDIGGINSSGRFFIGNVDESLVNVLIDTGSTGSTKIPYLLRPIPAPAIAWLPAGSLESDTLNGVVEYFPVASSGSDTTLAFDFTVPTDAAGIIDSIQIEWKFDVSAADFVSQFIGYKGVAVGEAVSFSSFSGVQRDTTTSETTLQRTTFVTNWTGLAGERVCIQLGRDNSITNNDANNYWFFGGTIYFH